MSRLRHYVALFFASERPASEIVLMILRKGVSLVRQWRLYARYKYFGSRALLLRAAIDDATVQSFMQLDLSAFMARAVPSDDLGDEKYEKMANAIFQHRFDILGKETVWEYEAAGEVTGYRRIPWCSDMKSGYRWDAHVWSRNVPIAPPTDIKVPWDLSRLQHLATLGECYRRLKREEYAEEFVNEALDWMEANPFCCGPNWNCTMEVGIRASNLLVAFGHFRHSPRIGKPFVKKLLELLYLHALYIEYHPEKAGGFASNHYTANIAGLYFIAVCCPFFPASARWRVFARAELEFEIGRQTFEDGFNFESSIPYHRLVLEMFLYSSFLADAVDEPFSRHYADTLQKMLAAAVYVLKPNGELPQVGDNDSGRFLYLNYAHSLDSLNGEYLAYYLKRGFPVESGQAAAYCQPSGRFVFRDNDTYLLVTAGPKGQEGRGGHAHNDVLSFELNVKGRDIFVDPGTYCYTPEPATRNRFRSAAYHNTLWWPTIEPCPLDHLFLLKEKGELSLLELKDNDGFALLHGRYAYAGRWHERKIILDRKRGEVLIEDRCSHEGAVVNFICHPSVKPIAGENLVNLGGVTMYYEQSLTMNIAMACYSSGYGKITNTAKMEFHLAGKEFTCRISARSVGD